MNSKFDKYLKALRQENVSEEEKENLLAELHRSYAWLSQEEQKAAASFLYDVKNGKQLEPNITFMDYITEYLHNKETKEFKKVVAIFGLDENMLKNILDLHPQNLKELQAF
jgi:type I restriction enzyme R subunit